MKTVVLLIFAIALLAVCSGVFADVTVTYLYCDFNGAYTNRLGNTQLVEEHWHQGWLNCNYEQENGSTIPPYGQPYPHVNPLGPHIGQDSVQALRYYKSAGQHNWSISYIESWDPHTQSKNLDLIQLAEDRGWLPIDITKPITYSVMVLGENRAIDPDDPNAYWKQQLRIFRPNWVWDVVAWTRANNWTWQKLSVTATGLLDNRTQWIILENDYAGRDNYPELPHDYWYYLPDPNPAEGEYGASTGVWENFTITYTPLSGSIPDNIGKAKLMCDGAPAVFTNKIVTAVHPSGAEKRIYIEEADRSSGIWVEPKTGTSSFPSLNDKVSVTGHIFTHDKIGERFVAEAEITTTGSGEVAPVFMNDSAVGGGAYGQYTPGMTGRYGLNNVGLLVKVFGLCTWFEDRPAPDPDYFYLDDGSGYLDGTMHNDAGVYKPNVGIRVYDTSDATVWMGDWGTGQGVLAKIIPENGTEPILAVLPRLPGDIALVQAGSGP